MAEKKRELTAEERRARNEASVVGMAKMFPPKKQTKKGDNKKK